MKKLMTMMLALSFLAGTAVVCFGAEDAPAKTEKKKKTGKKKKEETKKEQR